MTARERAIAGLGGCCAWGPDHPPPYQIDHIAGGGNQHRAQLGSTKLEVWLCREYDATGAWPAGYQLLCGPCHNRKSGRVPRMPAKAGTQQHNIVLDETWSRQLIALAAAPDYGSKSEVVLAALRLLIEGAASDAAMDSVQGRIDRLSLDMTTALRELKQSLDQYSLVLERALTAQTGQDTTEGTRIAQLLKAYDGPSGANDRFFTVRRNSGRISSCLPYRTAFKNKGIRETFPERVGIRWNIS
jgi:Arc/MetJ-type ribon-helix-helix transcriptional regulator